MLVDAQAALLLAARNGLQASEAELEDLESRLTSDTAEAIFTGDDPLIVFRAQASNSQARDSSQTVQQADVQTNKHREQSAIILKASVGSQYDPASAKECLFITRRSQKELTLGHAEPSRGDAGLEWLVLNHGGTIQDFHEVVERIYLPSLGEKASTSATQQGQLALQSTAGELQSSLSTFSNIVREYCQATKEVEILDVPEALEHLSDEPNDEELLLLEQSIASWSLAISTALETISSGNVAKRRPLQELNYWQTCKHVCFTLSDQLQRGTIKRAVATFLACSTDRGLKSTFSGLLETLKKAGSIVVPSEHHTCSSFREVRVIWRKSNGNNLNRHGLVCRWSSLKTHQFQAQSLLAKVILLQAVEEAKDNVKFLNTLERHLRLLEDPPADSVKAFQLIKEALPPLLESLRLVWVLSSYYSQDDTMGALLQQIGIQIADCVDSRVAVAAVLAMPEAEAACLLTAAISLLQAWQSSYLQTRDSIEAGGRDARWEFNKALLFEQTNHMVTICKDLKHIVSSVAALRQFLGPELKAVTGDVAAIDAVIISVEGMAQGPQSLERQIFSRQHASEWKQVMSSFNGSLLASQKATQEVVDSCFRKLKSASAACDLLSSISAMAGASEGAMQRQVLGKLDSILHHFSREIHAAGDIFHENKANPPISKGATAVAGQVAWARSLFARCRLTMDKILQLQPDLTSQALGLQVETQYRKFAWLLLGFENLLIASWREQVESVVSKALKQPLLHQADGSPKMEVNWSREAELAIREGVNLDQLEIKIPATVQAAILMAEQLRLKQEALRQLVTHFYEAVDSLSSVEKEILMPRLAKLRGQLQPGFSSLIWSSLTIDSFTWQAEKAITEFQSLVASIHKCSKSIEKSISAIAAAKLCPKLSKERNSPVLEFSDICEQVMQHQKKAVDELLLKYQSIPQQLKKIEELIEGSSSGNCSALAVYYCHWEHQIFSALQLAVVRGLKELTTALTLKPQLDSPHALNQTAPPRFKVSVTIVASEIVSSPAVNDLKKGLARLARLIAECGLSFARWKDGSCLEAPEILGSQDDDEPFKYTYFADLSHSGVVVKTILGITHAASRMATSLSKCIEAWRSFSHFWKLDAESFVADLQAREDVDMREQLERLDATASSIVDLAALWELDLLLVDAEPLAHVIRKECLARRKVITGENGFAGADLSR